LLASKGMDTVTGTAKLVPCGVIAYVEPIAVTPLGNAGALPESTATAIATSLLKALAGITTFAPSAALTVPPATPMVLDELLLLDELELELTLELELVLEVELVLL
jgi:hypothetical protein